MRLFARGGRAVKLTPDGERYFEAVSGALAMLEDASRGLLREARGGLEPAQVVGVSGQGAPPPGRRLGRGQA